MAYHKRRKASQQKILANTTEWTRRAVAEKLYQSGILEGAKKEGGEV